MTPHLSRVIPHKPTPKQAAFLLLNQREAFYGGAARGGKSDALLMGAAQYVDIPGYSALLLRRTSPQLTRADGLIPRSHAWFGQFGKWNEKKLTWTFPTSGAPATIEFGHMQYDYDKFNYQGSEYHFIGFDELTHFLLSQYTYMFSRLSQPADLTNPLSRIPLRIRSTGNPGGVGHAWVFRRFTNPKRSEIEKNLRPFVPAVLTDNPHINQEDYRKTLQELDAVTRRQLEKGDWTVRQEGSLFNRDWFGNALLHRPHDIVRRVRAWDLAHSKPTEQNPDPDWTVGFEYARDKNKRFFVLDIVRFRDTAAGVEKRIKETAERDGQGVRIRMEQEPAAGKSIVDRYAREVLAGYDFKGVRPRPAEPVLCYNAVTSASENGLVSVLESNWNESFFEELELITAEVNDGIHDDQAKAWAIAHDALCFENTEADVY